MQRPLAIVLLSATLAMAGVASADDLKLNAELSGDQEVPARVTDGEGEAKFETNGSSVAFELKWADLTTSAFAAHIHCGAAGTNGPVGVTLFVGSRGTEGEVKSSFMGPDPGNACGWDDLDEVLAAMTAGVTYVNVHTQRFPGGEIRGQIAMD